MGVTITSKKGSWGVTKEKNAMTVGDSLNKEHSEYSGLKRRREVN
jgi:hypothetical protein